MIGRLPKPEHRMQDLFRRVSPILRQRERVMEHLCRAEAAEEARKGSSHPLDANDCLATRSLAEEYRGATPDGEIGSPPDGEARPLLVR